MGYNNCGRARYHMEEGSVLSRDYNIHTGVDLEGEFRGHDPSPQSWNHCMIIVRLSMVNVFKCT